MEKLMIKKAMFSFHSLLLNDPRISYRDLHSASPYKTEYGTTQFVKGLFEDLVFVGPFLYCNSGISVDLYEDLDKPLTFLEEKKEEEGVTHVTALMGDYSAIVFKKGASILDYAEHTSPCLEGKGPESIYFENGKPLPADLYPHRWSEIDWLVYNNMRKPRDLYFWQVGQKIGLSAQTIREHYNSIINNCKIHLSLFPRGYYNYSQLLLTFKTRYETGLRNELMKLDRSSYLFKCKDLIILILFVDSKFYGKPCRAFKEMEEKGIIKDLKASIPIEFYSFLDKF